jgi:hypothetical protein
LEKRVEQVLPGSKGLGERGDGGRGRNGPNNVCTYEYMNKGEKSCIHCRQFVTGIISQQILTNPFWAFAMK